MKKQSKATDTASLQAEPATGTPKYPKPKVLLLDMSSAVAQAVAGRGFNIATGTLGTPYRVTSREGYQAVIGYPDLPNFAEQEIVVVDFLIDDLAAGPSGEKHRPNGEPDLWAKCDRGFIDPRARSAYNSQESFNRILNNGGLFILFADKKSGIEMQLARCGDRSLYDEQPFYADVWHIVEDVADMTVVEDDGVEMQCSDDQTPLAILLSEHLAGGRFTCTLEGGYRREDDWVTLAENKFGDSVALCRCRGLNGSVIVLPQIAHKAAFLSKLFTNVLPDIAPHLFPHIEKGKWTHRPEYELARIADLRNAQAQVEARAKDEIAALEGEIDSERALHGWMHDLLTGTDTGLVEAVKKALSVFGFSNVVDIDVERDREGKSRREDLQIRDQSPTVVVDIKGIAGFPSDEDALQADKHAAIRMREQSRTDIVGLAIVNHQRHLPPLERDNTMPFRQELLDAAEEL